MGIFEIFQSKSDVYYFRLKAGNGQVILNSHRYTTKAAVRNGIASVKKHIQDENFAIYEDRSRRYQFSLKASNGQTIGLSSKYRSKAGCRNGIKSVQKHSPTGEIKDLT